MNTVLLHCRRLLFEQWLPRFGKDHLILIKFTHIALRKFSDFIETCKKIDISFLKKIRGRIESVPVPAFQKLNLVRVPNFIRYHMFLVHCRSGRGMIRMILLLCTRYSKRLPWFLSGICVARYLVCGMVNFLATTLMELLLAFTKEVSPAIYSGADSFSCIAVHLLFFYRGYRTSISRYRNL